MTKKIYRRRSDVTDLHQSDQIVGTPLIEVRRIFNTKLASEYCLFCNKKLPVLTRTGHIRKTMFCTPVHGKLFRQDTKRTKPKAWRGIKRSTWLGK